MKRITTYIRPHQLELVKSAIAVLAVSGLNVTEIRGRGNSEEKQQRFLSDMDVLRLRSRVEVVCSDEVAEEVIEAILSSARTGQAGDGKIFVEPVLDAIRIRTGEKGGLAI